ncbi:MAG: hypothetical protein AAF583_02510 [Pseudomonadota bacterium]
MGTELLMFNNLPGGLYASDFMARCKEKGVRLMPDASFDLDFVSA